MTNLQIPPGAESGGVLAESDLDPFDLMDRGTFSRYVKHFAPGLHKPGMRRDDLILGDGTVEVVGVKGQLKQRGLKGTEPIPARVRAGAKATPEAEEEFREASVQAQVKIGAELQGKMDKLPFHALKSLGKKMGVRQTPKTKKQELQQMILDAAAEA